VPKDDDSNVHGTEDGQLMRLLEKTALALQESLMALISIFLRPMMNSGLRRQRASSVEGYEAATVVARSREFVEGRGVD
jgi:hypothetical protein